MASGNVSLVGLHRLDELAFARTVESVGRVVWIVLFLDAHSFHHLPDLVLLIGVGPHLALQTEVS